VAKQGRRIAANLKGKQNVGFGVLLHFCAGVRKDLGLTRSREAVVAEEGRRWLQDTSKRKLADFLIFPPPPFLFPRVNPRLTRR